MTKDIICGIYKIISPSGKIYIGQAVNINKRWKNYISLHGSVKGQTILYRSFLKHGTNKHIFKVIDTISGIVYDCLRDDSKKNGISYHTLQKKLSGVYKNNTTLKYLTND